MKVLYITPGCFDKGGISRYSRYQITALRETYGLQNIKVLSFLGQDNHSFESDFNVNWSGAGRGFIDRVLLVINIFYYGFFCRPNVIHTAHINYSGLAKLVSNLISAKTILNVYGLELWTNLKKHAAYGLKNSDLVISDCFATKEYIVKNNLTNTEKNIHVVWDCVDTEMFRPFDNGFKEVIIKYGLPSREESFIITTLGRMSRDAAYKGYDRLIDVFVKINTKYPDTYLLMIGRGDLLDELKKQAHDAGVEDKVIFTGSVTDEELPLLLSYGHIFSLVTKSGDGMGEGLPLTPLEAMSCGLPIIVGNQDGSREAIIDNTNGYCIDPDDLEKHESIIEAAYNDRELLTKKSIGALESIKKYFSYEIFLKKTIDLYQNYIQN